MASFFLAPDPIQSTFLIPGGVVPGNGAQLFIYVAGSVSTPTTVYKDNAGNTAWSNPIVLDSGGNLPSGGVVWIPSGVTIKAIWAPANDTSPPASPYRTIDNIAGINDTTASQTEWIAGPTPTFVSASQFTLVGDQTTTFTKGRRLKFTVTAGTVYGAITSSVFGVLTTVNVAFASGALDAGLTAVSYSLIAPDNPSINADYINKQASSAASAGNGTTNVWGVAGNSLHVTGTNAIFSFSSAPYVGAKRTVIFDGVLSLNSSAAITMPGNLNVTTAVNDQIDIYANTATTAIVNFYKASGGQVGPNANGSFTFDVAGATGTTAVTGVGFKPRLVQFFAAVSADAKVSIGVDSITNAGCIYNAGNVTAGTWDFDNVNSIQMQGAAGNNTAAKVQSFDTDGFTISRTKTGAPAGTCNVRYTAWR